MSSYHPLTKILENRKSFTRIATGVKDVDLEQVNTETGRFYKTPAGLLYPSVTTVTGLLGRASIQAWRKKVGEEQANAISQKAANRGTRIHQLAEDYIDGRDIEVDKYSMQDAEMFENLKKVLDGSVDNVRMQETRMYSDYIRMAGTVDMVADFEGKRSIVDFKTAKKLKRSEDILNYYCQATAYAIMFEEMTEIPVSRFAIVIAVDDEGIQIFRGKRDDYVDTLMKLRKQYDEENGLTNNSTRGINNNADVVDI